MTSYFKIHDILSFQIIDRRPALLRKWLPVSNRYGMFKTAAFAVEEADLVVEIGQFQPDLQDCYVIGGEYFIKPDYLYHSGDHYKLGGLYSFDISGLNTGRCRLRISTNPQATPFISGWVIDFFIFYLLTRKGYSLLHASAVARNGQALMFAGRGGGGKTTLAMLCMERAGYAFLGDNYILCKEGQVFSYLSRLNLFGYNLRPEIWEKMSAKERFSFRLSTLIHRMTGGYIKIFTPFHPMRLYPDRICEQAHLAKLALLVSRGCRDAEAVQRAQVLASLVSNMKLEFISFMRHVDEYGSVYPDTPFAVHWQHYQQLLEQNLPVETEYFLACMPDRIHNESIGEILDEIGLAEMGCN